MKNWLKGVLPAAFALAVASPAHALLTLDQILLPGANDLSDDSVELLVDRDSSGGISLGDYLIGTAVITSFPTEGTSASLVDQITIVFGVEVLTTPTANVGGCGSPLITTCSNFTFGSGTTTLNDKLTAGGVATVAGGSTADSTATFYEDATSNYTNTTVPLAFSTASDGSLIIVAGDPAGGAVTDFWSGTGPTDISQFALVPPGTGIGGFSLNQTMLAENLAHDFSPLITGRGTISSCTTVGAFPICDDTTLTIRTVPEPAMLALLGIGLLGVGATTLRRRRNR
jgi:hypothetical protein